LDSELAKAAGLAQAGRFEEAAAVYRSLLARAPGHPQATHFLGFCLVRCGRGDEGMRLLARALEMAPGSTQYRQNYALLLAEAGQLAAAEQQFAAILAANPGSSAAANDLGFCRLQRGDLLGAEQALRRALACGPDNAMAHNNLGSVLRALGQPEAAAQSYRRALACAPRFADAHHNLALTLRELGDSPGALAQARAAARAAPEKAAAWQLFADLLAPARFPAGDAALAADCERLFAQTDVEVQHCAEAVLGLVRRAPRGRLFLLLLENALVADEAFEAELCALRREALLAPQSLELACALAQQCFMNEYLWPESADETRALEALASRAASPLELASLAMYRPIAGRARPTGGGAAFERMWRRLVDEPRAEAALQAAIPVLTPVDDAVSRRVRAQYEESPYPRWHRAPAVASCPLALLLRSLFPHVSDLQVPERPEVLIAGCGTGRHAAITARLQPLASVLAVDLSRASLAHAKRRCAELGLRNVRFAQADILRLRGRAERFDVIECAGVLHHMEDPLEGWRALLSLLRPGGLMKVALYSELGRRAVAAARELVEGLDVREARRRILALPAAHPARAVARSRDFYSVSGTRDLVLHVQEQRFTLPELERAIASLGLEFLGFELDRPALPARGALPASLEDWAQLEAAEPDTFSAMYQFWVRR
jgi:SAM-dependent methyltransferase/Flp pilus assembly protein TadD